MALYFCSFASGSSGNSYLIKTEKTALLLDCGISGKKIKDALKASDLSSSDLAAILITHEHTDHVKSIRVTSGNAKSAPIYASEGTLSQIRDKVPYERTRVISSDKESFSVGDIKIRPFKVSHDALEPFGYEFEADGRKITVLTDTGYITDRAFDLSLESDLLVLEANHEKNILLCGPYPYSLKQRILSPMGHISNDDAADCLLKIMQERKSPKKPTFALAHLSTTNNSPDMAVLTVKNHLFGENFIENEDYTLTVLARDRNSHMIRL